MRQVQAYECSYCKKLFLNIERCIIHEKTCKKNPDGLSCKNCDHAKLIPNNAILISGGKGQRMVCPYANPSRANFLKCKHRSISM